MFNRSEITVTDAVGNTFPLTSCTSLHPCYGELDFGEPMALLFPDQETVVPLIDYEDQAYQLTGPDQEQVLPDDIDWENTLE